MTKMMRGSSKGGRRRPFWCLPLLHNPGLVLFMAYWTAAFSAVLATGQTQAGVASASVIGMEMVRKGGGVGIGVGGGPPGITVAMSPGLPSTSCQLALANLKVQFLALTSSARIFCHTQFVPAFETVSQGTMYINCLYLCVPMPCKMYPIS